MTKYKLLIAFLFAIIASPYVRSYESFKILTNDSIYYFVSGVPLTYEEFAKQNYEMTADVRGFLIPKKSVGINATIKVELKYLVRGENGLDTIKSTESVPVISIAGYAFSNRTIIESISIPSSVKRIGSSAFANCTSLTSANVPASVEEVGASIFYGCTSLKSASWNAKILNGGTFAKCTSLTQVGIGNGVEYVDNGAFQGCTSLESVSFPSSVKEIGTTIGSVYGAVLQDCTSLKSVILAGEKLGSVFYNNPALTSITIPSSVKSMYSLGYGLTGLKTLTFSRSTEPLKISGIISSIMPLEHLVIARPLETTSTLGSHKTLRTADVTGMGNIPNSFFSGCTELRVVNFKASVIGYNAFSGCSSLYSVNGLGANLVGVKELGSSAFSGCSSIRSITWGSIKEIPQGAFYGCSSLTTVILPPFLKSVGSNAFGNCTGIKYFSTGPSVKEVNALGGCVDIEELHLGQNVTYFSGVLSYDWTKLRVISSTNPTPPTIPYFPDVVFKNAQVRIAAGSREAYAKHSVWGKFACFAEENVKSKDISKPAKIYWDNSAAGWTTPSVYYLDADGEEIVEYPGVPMAYQSAGKSRAEAPEVYSIELPEGAKFFIFCDADSDANNGTWTECADGDGHIFDMEGDKGEYVSSVENILIDSELDEENIVYYDLMGRRVMNPSKGTLLLRRHGDKVEKIIVR